GDDLAGPGLPEGAGGVGDGGRRRLAGVRLGPGVVLGEEAALLVEQGDALAGVGVEQLLALELAGAELAGEGESALGLGGVGVELEGLLVKAEGGVDLVLFQGPLGL